MNGRQPVPLTGRKVLFIALAAFGVVIAANMVLLVSSISSFSGLVVRNSYVASQGFDAAKAAQEALGWTVSVEHDNSTLHIEIMDETGTVVRPDELSVRVDRPSGRPSDDTISLDYSPRGYSAELPLDAGIWNVEFRARAANGVDFRQRHEIYIAKTDE